MRMTMHLQASLIWVSLVVLDTNARHSKRLDVRLSKPTREYIEEFFFFNNSVKRLGYLEAHETFCQSRELLE